MLNLFYQKKTLDDTLIINVSSVKANKVVVKEDARIGYCDDKLVFVNVFNASKYINNLKDGILFPTKDLLDNLNKLLDINFTNYFDNGFKVGLVEKCEEIKGTHLHKCVVDIKDRKLDIVCGAANCRQGLKVVVATNGTMLPNGRAIILGSLLGNKSEGMLCSFRELKMDRPSTGIIELDDKYQVGDFYKDVYSNC